MTIRGGIGILLAAWLAAACAPQPTRPVVHERIADEMQQAARERKSISAEAAEKALMPPLVVEMPPSAAPTEPRFDLSVVNAPVNQVFMAIVTGTRYNMLLGPEVTGQVTLNLKDVTVRETLETIRDLYGYEFEIKGNRIFVQPNTLQTRVFQLNYLASRRQGTTELRVTSSAIAGAGGTGGTGGTATPTTGTQPLPAGTGTTGQAASNLTSRVQTSSETDFWHDLGSTLTAIVGSGEGRSVVVNSMSGVVVVRALPRELRSVEQYLKATQAIVERQVMLEAKIIEVSLSEEFQSGINWSSFNRRDSRLSVGVVSSGSTMQPSGALNVPSSVTATPGVGGSIVASALGKGFFGLAFQTANFAALLNFLETQGTVSVLSSPRIATLNNQKAVLKVGTDELFVTNVTTTSTTSAAGTVNTPSLTLQPYFSGISLDVTPQVDEDGNIILHIHPAVSVVQEKEKNIDLGTLLGQFKLPLASSSVNETDSIVRVQDGNIVAIGGLMTQSQSSDRTGLPGSTAAAGGALFGQRSSKLSKRELVILLKPTVLRDDRAWVRDLEQTGERLRSLEPRDAPAR